MRPMSEQHRVVNQEGFVLVPLDEIDEETVDRIRTVRDLAALAISHQETIPEALDGLRSPRLDSRPYAVLIEAVPLENIRLLAKMVDLPFPADGRGVTGVSQHPGEGRETIRSQPGTTPARNVVVLHPAMTKGVLAGEQGHASRSADRHAPGCLIAYPLPGQTVYVRGLVGGPVAADPVPAHVIDHDEDNVGLLRRLRGTGDEEKEDQFFHFV